MNNTSCSCLITDQVLEHFDTKSCLSATSFQESLNGGSEQLSNDDFEMHTFSDFQTPPNVDVTPEDTEKIAFRPEMESILNLDMSNLESVADTDSGSSDPIATSDEELSRSSSFSGIDLEGVLNVPYDFDNFNDSSGSSISSNENNFTSFKMIRSGTSAYAKFTGDTILFIASKNSLYIYDENLSLICAIKDVISSTSSPDLGLSSIQLFNH